MNYSGTSPTQAHAIATKVAKYRSSYLTFAAEQLKISGQPFKLWPCQIPLWQSVEAQLKERGFVRSVWLKARQVGASTFAESLVAWRTMLWPHTNAIVIADEAVRAGNLYDISRSFYDNLDEDVKPVGRYQTKRELVFANPSSVGRRSDPGLRSRIVIESAHKKNIAIGTNWQFAHLSEAARFRNYQYVMDGIIPAVHRVPGTFIIVESSAEMAGHWYREFCEQAERGENSFEFKFVPWYLQPEYYVCPKCKKVYPNVCLNQEHQLYGINDVSADERHIMAEHGLMPGHILWVREKLGEMGNNWSLFTQNYPLTPADAWVTPGSQAFPSNKLAELRAQIQPPKRRCEVHPGAHMIDNPNGRLLIWDEPKVGKAYDIGVDVASGIGRDDEVESESLDFSVACVLERGTNKQVAEWSSKAVDPFDFAALLFSLGKYYQDAQIAVETNGIGGATNQQLTKMGYSNTYIWRYRDEAAPRYSKKTGWETNPRSKPWLVGFAIHEMVNDRIQIRSEILLREMETFVMDGANSWNAAAKCHDDRVLAWMIALLTSDDENFERYYGLTKEVDRQYRKTDPNAPPLKKPERYEADHEFATLSRKKSYDDDWKPWEDETTNKGGLYGIASDWAQS